MDIDRQQINRLKEKILRSDYIESFIEEFPDSAKYILNERQLLGYNSGLSGHRLIFRATRGEGSRVSGFSDFLDVDIADAYGSHNQNEFGLDECNHDTWICGNLKGTKGRESRVCIVVIENDRGLNV